MRQQAAFCRAEQLRQRMDVGEVLIGGHTFLKDAAITEIMGCHGYDFVWIDGEHSPLDLAAMDAHIMAASAADTASFVRVAWNDPVRIKPVLDMGADGIILPMICTAEEARQAVDACCYPPQGSRGFGPRRADRYGALPADAYRQHARSRFLLIVQIEHVRAVKAIDNILAVPGIDLMIIGPNDLSGSIGKLGQLKDPQVLELCLRTSAACRDAGVPYGISLPTGDLEGMEYWISQGASAIGCGDDMGFIARGARMTLNAAHLAVEAHRAG